ncbi:hypothetical protein CW740_08595 [Kangiella profundi]|uniref:Intracellular proteinase inhibitor BsuPI domain-containing protein n=1 Tax=Kangiella profundi TaxID=1561924 RepID=A0A2K9AZJ7_9GAMM|nr:BsuPI-related putative proteinase inhibitor [Kangiella profundi]AUD79299.1 hypothetical protein CW740_08595 [Kangiella profundi]GGE99748.1 hypothetical protein GCM10011356_11870 [Kangiella profundi]
MNTQNNIINVFFATSIMAVSMAKATELDSFNDYKEFTSNHGKSQTIALSERFSSQWKQLSNYLGKEMMWLKTTDTFISALSEQSRSVKLVNFNDPVGTRYSVNLDSCTQSAIVAEKSQSMTTLAATFGSVVRVDFDGFCNDAGLISAWFSQEAGLIKWSELTIAGEVDYELEYAKLAGMNYPAHEGIEVSATFPAETVMLNEVDSVEAYITLTNQTSEPVELTFNSGQLFDIYIYDRNDQLVSQWSSGRMFTQAFRTINLQPGQKERFGGSLELKDLSGSPLDIGTYKIKIEVKTSTKASDELFQLIPFEAEGQLHIDDMMHHH